MKALNLTVTKKWFDMIASGIKKEEYSEVKPYWINRLTWHEHHSKGTIELIHALSNEETFRKDFDIVRFKNGYSSKARTIDVEFKGIHYGMPKEGWIESDLNNWYFCIKLGDIIK